MWGPELRTAFLAGSFGLIGGCLALIAMHAGKLWADKKRPTEVPEEDVEEFEFDYRLGDTVRHRNGVFEFAYLVEEDWERMRAYVSIQTTVHGCKVCAYAWYSMFEIERARSTEEIERARRAVDK